MAPIPLFDIDGVEAHFGCRAKHGATVYVAAISGRVSPCIRAPLACAGGAIYDPASRNRLSEILESEPFRQYRADCHGLEVCEAFSRAEADRAES